MIIKDREVYNKYHREYRANNRKKIRDYKRVYNARWRKEHNYSTDRRGARNEPWKIYARNIFSAAITSGKVKRKPCEVCSEKDANGHHEDYSEPLKVVWLCPFHHSDRHREITRLGVDLSRNVDKFLWTYGKK